MAGPVFPYQGALELAKNMLITNSFDEYTYLVDLYTNDYDPDLNASPSNFTIADFEDYEQLSFTRAQWTVPEIVPPYVQVSCTLNPLQWQTAGPPVDVYGYLVRSSVSGMVLWAEYYGDPFQIGLGVGLSQPITLLLFSFNQ